MSHDYSWEDVVCTTSVGSRVIFHPTLPTIVYPQARRPRAEWDGLALMEIADVISMWEEEERDEKASKGVNAEMARVQGGIFGLMISGFSLLPELQAGVFPDPEPRRFCRNAERHQRPIYFIEPSYNDEDWIDFLEKSAKAMSHWKKLLGMVRPGRRFRKRLKHHLSNVPVPPHYLSDEYATAYALTSSWWDCKEWLIGEELAHRRNKRMASRIKGAVEQLARHLGRDDVTLMVPIFAPWLGTIVQEFDTANPEEISSSQTDTNDQEEE
ncbi:MAG: hypothetical protein VW230_03500 [Candidatus Poseidoniales archaeon]